MTSPAGAAAVDPPGSPLRARARAILGVAVGLVARLWVATLRVTVLPPPVALPADRPWVLAFFHGQQFALLRWPRRRPTAVLVSLSRDGDIQARVMPRLGLVVRRGSSSRGGARGLAALLRLLRSGHDAAFAVDGPRGPWGAVHPGAAAAAHHARGVLVPLACASSPRLVLGRTWDRFELPLPFARVTIAVGAPLPCPDDPATMTEALREAIVEAWGRARASVGEVPGAALPAPPTLPLPVARGGGEVPVARLEAPERERTTPGEADNGDLSSPSGLRPGGGGGGGRGGP